MNSNDEKLRDFFYDILHVSYYQNSDGLSKFYDECMQILKDKSYSDINIQDEDGNTYLHYISQHGKWNWFIDLLHNGADPTIKNNAGRTPFQSSRHETGNLWRMSPFRDVDNFANKQLPEIMKNLAPNFKDFLFQGNLMTNSSVFKDITEAIDFLENIGIDNDINRIRLVAISRFIHINEKIKWYNNNYNSAEKNTDFFNKLRKTIPFDHKERKLFYQLLSKFLNNKFEQNSEFNKSVYSILQEPPEKLNMEFCKSLVKTLIKQKFNLNIKEEGEKHTLMQVIENNPVFYSLYMDETLSKNKNISTKKRVKV